MARKPTTQKSKTAKPKAAKKAKTAKPKAAKPKAARAKAARPKARKAAAKHADISGDGIVNIRDLSLVGANFRSRTGCRGCERAAHDRPGCESAAHGYPGTDKCRGQGRHLWHHADGHSPAKPGAGGGFG